MTNVTFDLIEAYDAYIELLGDELSELASLAYVHGWRTSRYEKGKTMREALEKLKAVAKANEPNY